MILINTGRHTLERYQFPLVLACAVTIPVVQGLSLDKAVMDLSEKLLAPGQAYIALIRVRSLDGVLLTGLNGSKLGYIDSSVSH